MYCKCKVIPLLHWVHIGTVHQGRLCWSYYEGCSWVFVVGWMFWQLMGEFERRIWQRAWGSGLEICKRRLWYLRGSLMLKVGVWFGWTVMWRDSKGFYKNGKVMAFLTEEMDVHLTISFSFHASFWTAPWFCWSLESLETTSYLKIRFGAHLYLCCT